MTEPTPSPLNSVITIDDERSTSGVRAAAQAHDRGFEPGVRVIAVNRKVNYNGGQAK
jgi:hypothetical protein